MTEGGYMGRISHGIILAVPLAAANQRREFLKILVSDWLQLKVLQELYRGLYDQYNRLRSCFKSFIALRKNDFAQKRGFCYY